MMKRTWMTPAAIMAALVLAGCGDAQKAEDPNGPPGQLPIAAPEPEPNAAMSAPAASEAPATDAWIGRWVGVEGLVLDIQPKAEPSLYNLKITLLDGTNSYEGRGQGDIIRFTRDGAEETIRHTDGAATGLKYLADKKDCLTIKSGEGFCRG